VVVTATGRVQPTNPVGLTVGSTFRAPVLLAIAEDLTQMEVQVDVDEADVGKVEEGQSATFSVDAYPDRRFPASIRELRFAAETVQGGTAAGRNVAGVLARGALLTWLPGPGARADRAGRLRTPAPVSPSGHRGPG
jgi:hypothetical protein